MAATPAINSVLLRRLGTKSLRQRPDGDLPAVRDEQRPVLDGRGRARIRDVAAAREVVDVHAAAGDVDGLGRSGVDEPRTLRQPVAGGRAADARLDDAADLGEDAEP